MQQAEDQAIRIALGSSQEASAVSEAEDAPVVVEVPSENPTSTPNSVEQMKESNEAGKETKEETKVSGITQEGTTDQTDQTKTEVTQDVASNTNTISPLPLVLYAYSESETARPNLEFFIRHALHSAADFVFILNGLTDAAATIPKLPNVRIVQRDNDCYDLGAYAEVLQKDDLWKGYGKFIMLNASLRGPFMPYWSDSCWMDMYLRKLTEEVKVLNPSQPTISNKRSKLTSTSARRHDSKLLANLPRAIHDLGHGQHRTLNPPLPTGTRTQLPKRKPRAATTRQKQREPPLHLPSSLTVNPYHPLRNRRIHHHRPARARRTPQPYRARSLPLPALHPPSTRHQPMFPHLGLRRRSRSFSDVAHQSGRLQSRRSDGGVPWD